MNVFVVVLIIICVIPIIYLNELRNHVVTTTINFVKSNIITINPANP